MTNQDKKNEADSLGKQAASSAAEISEDVTDSPEMTIQELEPRIAPLVVRKAGGEQL